MKSIRIEKLSKQGGAVRLTLLADGETLDSWQGKTLTSDRVLRPIAKVLKAPVHWLRTCLDKGEGEFLLPGGAEVEEAKDVRVFIRGINETEDKTQAYDSIDAALADKTLSVTEPIIYWERTSALCAVDADLHAFPYDQRPDEKTLSGRLVSIAPAPSFVWITHGRGVRLIYKKQGIYDASELAAVGAARLLQIEPLATVELKSTTRHPGYPSASGARCSEPEQREPTTDCRAILGWYEGRSDADSEDVKEWLESRGYEIGKRYEHDRCPVDPTSQSHGTPVVVYENGIFCYGCAGHGVRRGTRAPGWFPFQVFLGSPSVSAVARCVENLTHWEHAKFVLGSAHSLPESILRGAYSAMLKQKHGADQRLPAVFQNGRDVVRFSRFWGTLEGEGFSASRSDAIIAKLPATQYVEDGKVKVDGERVARLLQAVNLERYGYPHLRPVWGLPIYSQHLEPRYPYEIIMYKGPGQPPKYVPKGQRLDEEEAWRRIENAFPGLSRAAVKLLIAAKGSAEGDGTFPPFIFITGVTESGKTTTIHVAAAIAGDRVRSVPSIGDDQRLRAALMEAKNGGTYAVFNEAVKDGRRGKQIGKAEAMEWVLGLTADSVSHKLYVGPVEMGSLPVCCWTDTHLPQEIKEHGQLGRRIVHIHLPARVNWHQSVREVGLGRAEYLRAGGREYTEAADTILSNVIDQFFSAPSTFEEIARSLGYKTLAESSDAQEQKQELVAFYEEVMKLPERNGWREIEANESSLVSTMWRQLSDAPDHRTSQRISETDFQQLLGLPRPVVFSVNCKGSKVRVKFDDGKTENTSQPERREILLSLHDVETLNRVF